MRSYFLATGIIVASLCGCSSDKIEGGTAGDTSSASGKSAGGGSNGGNASSGGNASAGTVASGGSSSGGATLAGAHCSPGTPKSVESLLGLELGSCSSVSGLMGDIGFGSILDVQLNTPVGPGQTFAFSAELRGPEGLRPEGDLEMYGATRRCGDVGELLSTVHVSGEAIICLEVKPVTGTYSHMIWVRRVAANVTAVALCESGTCPAH